MNNNDIWFYNSKIEFKNGCFSNHWQNVKNDKLFFTKIHTKYIQKYKNKSFDIIWPLLNLSETICFILNKKKIFDLYFTLVFLISNDINWLSIDYHLMMILSFFWLQSKINQKLSNFVKKNQKKFKFFWTYHKKIKNHQ